MFNFVFDQSINGYPYPNLAPEINLHNGYHGLGDDYPFIGPLRLKYFCEDHGYPYSVTYTHQPMPDNAYYPIGLSFFCFDVDYFSMLSDKVKGLLREKKLKILFYYHEGDNPRHEKTRLDDLCDGHGLSRDCYRFVSGNTTADHVENFVYFPDHELFYWRNGVVWNNQPQPGCGFHSSTRDKEFTLLSRVHKWWRATVVSYLHQARLLDQSYWSYGDVDIGDQWQDNPIMLVDFPKLDSYMKQFVSQGPYRCDTLNSEQHNSHWMFVPEHYNNSYCHLVLETMFDADGSQGAFISEKTFKPMRHAQPFVIFGAPYTLKTLRRLGYRTYDHAIDNSYDNTVDNTKRFSQLISTVRQLKKTNLHEWYLSLEEDIRYNQAYFVANKYQRLADLATDLNTV